MDLHQALTKKYRHTIAQVVDEKGNVRLRAKVTYQDAEECEMKVIGTDGKHRVLRALNVGGQIVYTSREDLHMFGDE